ncbi:chromate transporter [Oxalicibacterium flavum]|uniref:Chromate transporter n=1 Tax=Oxalicibacterium flavum TaxID=179467 RepID=A0A8J2UK95_9BURK|nr:chromate efflux transporter [Oxalicibacterium flavum]GGC06126.1 chromate transporter [Oxalicibacterium flavum]
MTHPKTAAECGAPEDTIRIFLIFLRLGLTCFGGPVAHVAYFRDEFVARRRWLTERAYADLVALCQFLPGPASSQVGIALGLFRGGYVGALAAWLGFTLPSAILMVLFALGIAPHEVLLSSGMLYGLKVVAVAVVAQAVVGMARTLCTDIPRIALMLAAAGAALLFPVPLAQIAIIAVAGVIGLLLKPTLTTPHDPLPTTISRRAGLGWLCAFATLLAGLPILSHMFPMQTLAAVDAFYRTGALVFGGGHVVLPLLQSEVAHPGWIDADTFMAGYAAAQAVPGPLFTFAAFLGSAMPGFVSPWLGGMICLLAIFAPAFLLVAGVLPFWETLRRQPKAQAALAGINAAVVGLLLAAWYQPVWTTGIVDARDAALALLAFIALMFGRLPPWLVVAGSALSGWLLSTLP